MPGRHTSLCGHGPVQGAGWPGDLHRGPLPPAGLRAESDAGGAVLGRIGLAPLAGLVAAASPANPQEPTGIMIS